MKEYTFEILKCKSDYSSRLDEKDWYHRKCMYTGWGIQIVANHGYNEDEFNNPLDFEKIAMMAHESKSDFTYFSIGKRQMTASEALALSFNKTTGEVKQLESFVDKKYFHK